MISFNLPHVKEVSEKQEWKNTSTAIPITTTRKEIRKEKICSRCGLEAKKLFKTRTANNYSQIDWTIVTMHIAICLWIILILVGYFV